MSDVSNEEMKACADLINFIRGGDFSIKGSQSEDLFRSVSWLRSLAQSMLTTNTDPPIAATMPGGANVKIHRAKNK